MAFRGRMTGDRTLGPIQADLERDGRRRDADAQFADADEIVTFTGNYTAKPSDRVLVYRGGGDAILTLPSTSALPRNKSLLLRITNGSPNDVTLRVVGPAQEWIASDATRRSLLIWTTGPDRWTGGGTF